MRLLSVQNWKRICSLFSCAAFLFICDSLLKAYVSEKIPLIRWSSEAYPYGGISVFQNILGVSFSINYAVNKGTAWGLFSNFHVVLLYFRILVVSGLCLHVFFFNKERARDVPFVLIIAGALGNITDSFVYGHVVDMFYFTFGSYSYPIFNIADASIFSGVVLLFFGGKHFFPFPTAR